MKFINVIDLNGVTHCINVAHIIRIEEFPEASVIYMQGGFGLKTKMTIKQLDPFLPK